MAKITIGDIVRVCTPDDWNKTGVIVGFADVPDGDGWVKVKQNHRTNPRMQVLYFNGDDKWFPLNGTYAIRVEYSTASFLEREIRRYGDDSVSHL